MFINMGFLCNTIIKQDTQSTYNVTLRRVRSTIFAVGKSLSIAYSDYVSVAWGTQLAMRMRHIAISGLSGSTTFFSPIS
jgi:hypothetical protein